MGLVLAACGSTATLPEAVTGQLDIPNNPIATLSDSTSEDIPRLDLLQATARARAIGTELRFVIAGDTDELVDAEAVVEEYGGTVLSYKSGDTVFFAASKSMDNDQLNRAIEAAGSESDMGASALAFVRLLEDEGIQAQSSGVLSSRLLPSGVSPWIWVLLAVAAIFVLYQLWNYLRARKRAARRKAKFHERKEILSDWATRLVPEINAVTPHAGRLDSSGQRMLTESRDQVSKVVPALAEATSLGELDASEIRIARTAIKLRTLRQTLGV